MTTTENSGARDEYFVQISELCGKYFRTESFTLKRKCKEKVLEISYDTNVALQKRVEELEAVGMELIHAMNQKQFFLDGYSKGSASIAEASGAMADEHAAYSKLFDTIKNKKS